jgi:ribosomal protein S18 acetylase RimI-like enzyme
MNGLPPFPVRRGPAPETPEALRTYGYSLRHAVDGDLPRLAELYADTRAEELAQLSWPPEVLRDFLDQQFQFQHRHYLLQHPGAEFLVIERAAVVEGRYYLLREAPEHQIIDICLMSGCRGGGIGRALIEASQREARALERGMALQVMVTNARARALYERLGFEVDGYDGSHYTLRWRP